MKKKTTTKKNITKVPKMDYSTPVINQIDVNLEIRIDSEFSLVNLIQIERFVERLSKLRSVKTPHITVI